MAENENGTEKTEAPTGRRVGEARSEGQIGKSVDLGHVTGMIAAFLALQQLAPHLWDSLVIITTRSLSSPQGTQEMNLGTLNLDLWSVLRLVLPDILLLLAIAAGAGFLAVGIQTKFNFSMKIMRPKFNMINPMAGIKRIFSFQNMIQLLKSILKLCIIGPVAFFAFKDLFPQLINLMEVPVSALLQHASQAAAYVFWKIIWFLFTLGILDLAYQKYNIAKQMKMTKEEIKDEKKSTEGDEATKMAIRSKGLQRIRNRMMKAVPKADVVVTNPTHLAVALQYTPLPGESPKVVAKGRGFMAEQIKKIARQSGVPVLERKSLARTLFKEVEVGQHIPYDLFKAVAEILAYVYKLKGKNPLKNHRPKQTV